MNPARESKTKLRHTHYSASRAHERRFTGISEEGQDNGTRLGSDMRRNSENGLSMEQNLDLSLIDSIWSSFLDTRATIKLPFRVPMDVT